MKDYPNRNSTVAEQKFWTCLKTFFFCDEDEQLCWTDIAWLVLLGLAVLMVLIVTTR